MQEKFEFVANFSGIAKRRRRFCKCHTNSIKSSAQTTKAGLEQDPEFAVATILLDGVFLIILKLIYFSKKHLT